MAFDSLVNNLEYGDSLIIHVPVGNLPSHKEASNYNTQQSSNPAIQQSSNPIMCLAANQEVGNMQFTKITQQLTDEERVAFMSDIEISFAQAKITGDPYGV